MDFLDFVVLLVTLPAHILVSALCYVVSLLSNMGWLVQPQSAKSSCHLNVKIYRMRIPAQKILYNRNLGVTKHHNFWTIQSICKASQMRAMGQIFLWEASFHQLCVFTVINCLDTVGVSCERKRTVGDREELRRQMSLLRAATTTRIDEQVLHPAERAWLYLTFVTAWSFSCFTFVKKLLCDDWANFSFSCTEKTIDHCYVSCPTLAVSSLLPPSPPSLHHLLDIIHFIQTRNHKTRMTKLRHPPLIVKASPHTLSNFLEV